MREGERRASAGGGFDVYRDGKWIPLEGEKCDNCEGSGKIYGGDCGMCRGFGFIENETEKP